MADGQATEGQPFSVSVTATDPDVGDTLSFSLGASSPPLAQIAPSGATGAQITWTPGEVGPVVAFSVVVTDSAGATDVETFDVTYAAMTFDAGVPHIALRHGANLELITPDANGYWTYTVIDTMDSAMPDIAVDADGDPHICYQKNDTIHFY